MMTLHSFHRLSILFWVSFCLFAISATGNGETVEIVTFTQSPSGPIQTARDELLAFFRERDWEVSATTGLKDEPTGLDLQIVVDTFNPNHKQIQEMDVLQTVVPQPTQSFAILPFRVNTTTRVYALGRDGSGTLYAAFELMEQIENGKPSSPLTARIKEVKVSPSIPMRGYKIQLHREALFDPFSWFHLQTYWEEFLTSLAKARFNFLDIHGIYDWETGKNYSVFPYFTYLQDYASIGLTQEQVEQNMESLNTILRLAHDRGINVCFMNHRLSWNVPDGSGPIDTSQTEIEYFQKAIRQFVDACESLDGIGFWLGEPGKPESYYNNTFLKALNDAEHTPLLFLRTNTIQPEFIKKFMRQYSNHSLIEVKFNGDRLALTHPVTSPPAGQRKDAYQTYLQPPRPYGVLFDIRANGSFRLFPWNHIPSIRSTLASTTFCDANGFILESLHRIYPNRELFKKTSQGRQNYYQWPFERDWHWIGAWGRLAYDVTTPSRFLEVDFARHFDAETGPLLYRALQNSSQVIPAIESVCYHGANGNRFAPEFDPPPGISALLHTHSFDPFSVRSLAEEAEYMMTRLVDGKRSPLSLLEHAVQASQSALSDSNEVRDLILHSNRPKDEELAMLYREWRSWHTGFEILHALAQVWYNQATAAVQWHIFQETGDLPSLVTSAESLNAAQSAWDSVVRLTSDTYLPLPRPGNGKMAEYHWSTASTPFEADRSLLTEAYNQWLDTSTWVGDIGHAAIHRAGTGEPVLLTVSLPPAAAAPNLYVQYQNSAGYTDQIALEPSTLDHVLFAQIPGERVVEGVIQYFFFGVENKQLIELKDSSSTNPHRILVSSDKEPPSLVSLQHTQGEKQVTVMGQFSDPNTVNQARLYWKPIPSATQWNVKAMTQSTQGFSATVPLTSEGLLYAVDAIDRFGNVGRFPAITARQPYKVIKPFAAAGE
ncbi:hypothetical protein GF373_14495 [bacterium]|nr:hypothetical protein [bacterium]